MGIQINTKYIIFSFCILFKSCLVAQATFNKTIDFSNGDESGFSIITLDDGYILIGNGWGYEMDAYTDFKLKYAKIDLEGNIIWQKVLGDSAFNLFCYARSGIESQDGNIVFGGSRQTLTTSAMHMIKIDPNTGDTIFYNIFNFDDYIYGNQIREFSDGNLLMLGWDSDDSFASILVKTDFNGEFIWEKRFGTGSEVSSSDFEISANDTLYLINTTLNCTPPGYYLREIDSSGFVISTSHFPSADCPAMGKKSIINGFYGAGGYFPLPPYRNYVYRTDSIGSIIWHYNTSIDFDTLIYGELYPGLTKELPNGDIFVSGYYKSNDFGSYIGLVGKIDINGIPYWERFYTANENPFDDNRLQDMALTEDGGLIIIGAAFSDNEIEDQNFWVLKLDSMGCLIPGCDTLDVGIMDLTLSESNILIYPNPIKDEAIIQVSGVTDFNSIKILITDITGREILQESLNRQQIVDSNSTVRFGFSRKNIMSGIYLLSIYSNNQLLGTKQVIFQ